MALMWTFLLLLALSDVCLAVSIKFERAPSFPTDDFLLPDSLCPSFRPSCNLFNAHQLGGCWCSCPSTFSFYEHNFKCAKNSEARQSAGMPLVYSMNCVNRFFKEIIKHFDNHLSYTQTSNKPYIYQVFHG